MRYIPFYKPSIPPSAEKMIKGILKSGWITTGKYTDEFERKFAETVNTKHTVAVSSGTAALHLAYLSSGLKRGDEVIVPSFTFCSTVNMIVNCGFKPIFCDIDEKTLCLDPADVRKRITEKTRGIVVVHFEGMPADLDAINSIAREFWHHDHRGCRSCFPDKV